MQITPVQRYQALLCTLVAAFLYVSCTEVADRFAECSGLWNELSERKARVQDPESLKADHERLLARRDALADSIRAHAAAFENSPTGVLEFVNAAATSSHIRLDALVPEKADSGSKSSTLTLKMSLTAPFHGIGRFVNLLETGPYSLRIDGLDLTSEAVVSGSVKASCTGTVHLSRRGLP